jgi:uncharacterized SAM-binding protein YcdF (DUF218 family)
MRRVVWGLVKMLGLIVLAGSIAFAILAWRVDRLGQEDDARPADVIIVLGARVDPDGQPGSDLTSRTLHAVDLWQQRYAPEVICSGGFKNERLSAAAVCRDYAIKLGVPPGNVWLADGTTNTLGDAYAAAAVMGAHGWRSAILVSHPLHLYRARWFFREAGVDVVTSPTTTETGRIFLPLRTWYVIREAGALVVTTLDGWGWMPSALKAQLETWRLSLP